MKITIGLNQADFDCLRGNVSEDSPLWQVFKPWQKDDESGYMDFKHASPGIMPLTAEFHIYCSKEEGEQLLAIAKKHCLGAVSAINGGLAGRSI